MAGRGVWQLGKRGVRLGALRARWGVRGGVWRTGTWFDVGGAVRAGGCGERTRGAALDESAGMGNFKNVGLEMWWVGRCEELG